MDGNTQVTKQFIRNIKEMKRYVEMEDGEPQVQPTAKDKNISPTGCIYLMKVSADDPKHMVYKAHKVHGRYHWLGLWNSIVHCSAGQPTLPKLIKDALVKDYEVKECNYDDLLIRF